MTLRAYAKINLGLRIGERRPDGYHSIETVFHRVDLHDDITLSDSPDVRMTCTAGMLPVDERNLCVRAAMDLRRRCGVDKGARIHLEKRIPVGSGLGGGSADAAAVLNGLVRLWGLRVPDGELLAAAAALGSDVPYFLKEGSAYARGRGEILEYFILDLPYWIAVAFPRISVSTAWAYASFRPAPRSRPGNLKEAIIANLHDPAALQAHLENDFEASVLTAHPGAGRAREALLKSGAVCVRLSGSGSSVYALFAGEDQPRAAAAALAADCDVFVTPPHFSPPAA